MNEEALIDLFKRMAADGIDPAKSDPKAVQAWLSSNTNREDMQTISNLINRTSGSQDFQEKRDRAELSDKFITKYGPALQSLTQIAAQQIGAQQVRQSNQLLNNLQSPAAPTGPGVPPELQSQLNSAQTQGNEQAERAIAATKSANDEQYLNDVNTARQLSGGQGASYQSMVNAASLRRMRANAQLAPISDQIRARYQEMANQLAAQKGQLGQQQYATDLNKYGIQQEQYNINRNAATQLGQVGRINQWNAFNKIMDLAPSVAAQISYNNRPIQTPVSSYTVPPQFTHDPGQSDTYNKYNNIANNNEWNTENQMRSLYQPDYNPKY